MEKGRRRRGRRLPYCDDYFFFLAAFFAGFFAAAFFVAMRPHLPSILEIVLLYVWYSRLCAISKILPTQTLLVGTNFDHPEVV